MQLDESTHICVCIYHINTEILGTILYAKYTHTYKHTHIDNLCLLNPEED